MSYSDIEKTIQLIRIYHECSIKFDLVLSNLKTLPKFDPIACLSLFNNNANPDTHLVQLYDLQKYLFKVGIKAQSLEVVHLFNQLDIDQDGQISVQDIQIFLQTYIDQTDLHMTDQIKWSLNRLLNQVIDNYRTIQDSNCQFALSTLIPLDQIQIDNIPQEQIFHYYKQIKQRYMSYQSPTKSNNYVKKIKTEAKQGKQSNTRSSQKSKQNGSPVLKCNQEYQIAITMKQQVIQLKQLEKVRNKMLKQDDFHSKLAFNLLDQTKRGALTKLDFELACNSLDIHPSQQQIDLLYHQFTQGVIMQYEHFLSICIPIGYTEQVQMIQSALTNQTIKLIKQFLVQLLESLQGIQLIRYQFKQKLQFNIYKGFQALDEDNIGYIGERQIKKLFQSNGLLISDEELKILMSLYDRESSGKIRIEEFLRVLD